MRVPASALLRTAEATGVWVVDPEQQTVSFRAVDIADADPGTATVTAGLDVGDIVVTAGVSSLTRVGRFAFRETRRDPFQPVGWALRKPLDHAVPDGTASSWRLLAYQKLGRNEDPAFVFKSMVVSAACPGRRWRTRCRS